MADEKSEAELKRLINESEEWLSAYGAVTPRTHDAFLSNVYGNFPCVKYVEYYIPKDDAITQIKMILHIDVIEWLTSSRTVDRLRKLLPPVRFISNEKLEELLDVLPYVDFNFVKERRMHMEDGVKALAAKVLDGYDIDIIVKRWKPGTPKAQ